MGFRRIPIVGGMRVWGKWHGVAWDGMGWDGVVGIRLGARERNIVR